MRLLKLIAVLLTYPEQDWLQSLGELRDTVSAETGRSLRAGRRLDLLLSYLERGQLIDLQETYVETFDRRPTHSLYLFEHRMGESRDRGEAMVRLIDEYRRSGLEVTSRELPDFLPLFLEFLSLIPTKEAQERLTRIADVVQILRDRLEDAGSPYVGAFDALVTLTPDSRLAAALSAIRTRGHKLTAIRTGTR
ncbi:MAG: nitrate reductase molybdenum cofactor assembly chaperone [Nitrospira sp. LK70]|nr:nitrate reductase molybdenum cofactor assembly chaperone [Nitrospira sp. LK70]